MKRDEAAQDGPTGHEQHVRRLELALSYVLRMGVVASLLTVVAGSCVTLVRHPDYLESQAVLGRLMGPSAEFPHTLAQTWEGLREGRGRAICVMGLLLLILTPVMRVVVSIVAFALERDWAFVAMTTVVLAVLAASFLLGRVR